jgi:hypothetical protein
MRARSFFSSAGRQLPRLRAQRLHLAFTGPQCRAEHAQQRRLARARRADDGDALAIARGQRHPGQRALAVGMHHAHAVERKTHPRVPLT